jgi:hypothetical protein
MRMGKMMAAGVLVGAVLSLGGVQDVRGSGDDIRDQRDRSGTDVGPHAQAVQLTRTVRTRPETYVGGRPESRESSGGGSRCRQAPFPWDRKAGRPHG